MNNPLANQLVVYGLPTPECSREVGRVYFFKCWFCGSEVEEGAMSRLDI